MSNKSPSNTKRGPGRRHAQGKPEEQRGRGFRGVSFAPVRELSQFHPKERARLRAVYTASDMGTPFCRFIGMHDERTTSRPRHPGRARRCRGRADRARGE